MDSILYTCSAVDGHWVVFGSCGFVNNAACVHGLCGHAFSFLVGGYLGMELLGKLETLLNLSGTAKTLASFHVLDSSRGVVSLGHHEDNDGTSANGLMGVCVCLAQRYNEKAK